MIVEAIRTDAYTGPLELENGTHSRYTCDRCTVSYEFVIHAEEGEFDALCDPLPVHFEMLCDHIDAGHAAGHEILVMQTDGNRIWNPMKRHGDS